MSAFSEFQRYIKSRCLCMQCIINYNIPLRILWWWRIQDILEDSWQWELQLVLKRWVTFFSLFESNRGKLNFNSKSSVLVDKKKYRAIICQLKLHLSSTAALVCKRTPFILFLSDFFLYVHVAIRIVISWNCYMRVQSIHRLHANSLRFSSFEMEK